MSNHSNNDDLAKDFFDKGYLLQKNGHLDRAAHFYKRSIEFQPSAQAHTFLGWVYRLKGLFDQAIKECKNAIDLDPDYGNPYNDIGAYLLQQHRYDDAKIWFQRALDAPNYENYCYPFLNLGRVYEYKGEWDTAMDCYKNAIKENKDYEPAQIALKDLQAKYN